MDWAFLLKPFSKVKNLITTNMKNFLFVLIMIFSFSLSHGQKNLQLKKHENSLQAGDNLIKQQVEYKDPGSSGRDITWDFSMIKEVNDKYELSYFIPDSSKMDTLCGLEHNSRYYFQLKNDTLFALGFENSNTKIDYLDPEAKLIFPFNYGDTLFSEFNGLGEYSHFIELKVNGYTKVVADAIGKMKLPHNELIDDVLRIRTFRHYMETGRDSVEMTIDSYSWYGKQYRYPLFESIKTTLNRKGDSKTEFGESYNDTIIYTTSFYYPPELQTDQSLTDSTLLKENSPMGPYQIFTEASYQPNPVVTNLLISYKLTRSANVWFSLHNVSGIPIWQTSPRITPEGFNSIEINMSQEIPSAYTLYVHVDDMMVKQVIIKK